MPRPSKFSLAKKDIISFFEKSIYKFYDQEMLFQIFEDNRELWGLPKRMSYEKFINELVANTQLKEEYIGSAVRYIYRPTTVYELTGSLKKNGYFSHLSALYLHGILSEKPSALYFNREQGAKYYQGECVIAQSDIDNAFSKPQRVSNNIAFYNDYQIILLNGKYTNNEGIINLLHSAEGDLNTTSIERTLIDITVRPVYAGGVQNVLNAYEKLKGKVSGIAINTMLDKLDFIYPYHQAIGFYMETAGYGENDYNIFKDSGIDYDFYLAHGMEESSYSEKWRIYYPKNL
ncbi:MAG: hypothetical protein HGB27_05595 [Chlorobiaceae bacterium]|nr:hypothetical protein [Chlorobiaceae bacterium]